MNLCTYDELIAKAVELGGHKTKKAAVTQALVEYVRHIEQIRMISIFGTIDYDPRYNYKRQRGRDGSK